MPTIPLSSANPPLPPSLSLYPLPFLSDTRHNISPSLLLIIVIHKMFGGISSMVSRGFCGGGGAGASFRSSSSESSFEDLSADFAGKPLSAVAEAFEELSRSLRDGKSKDLRLSPFCSACALVSVLFGCLGFAFKFAEIEYVAKVHTLLEASKTYDILTSVIDYDVKNDTVKKPGSNTRNLRRVRQGLGLIQAIFEQFLTNDDGSLRAAASLAYSQECAPYHSWTIRKAVFAGMYALPTREQLITKLNETDDSVKMEMRRYIDASRPIIKYIDKLFVDRKISLDW